MRGVRTNKRLAAPQPSPWASVDHPVTNARELVISEMSQVLKPFPVGVRGLLRGLRELPRGGQRPCAGPGPGEGRLAGVHLRARRPDRSAIGARKADLDRPRPAPKAREAGSGIRGQPGPVPTMFPRLQPRPWRIFPFTINGWRTRGPLSCNNVRTRPNLGRHAPGARPAVKVCGCGLARPTSAAERRPERGRAVSPTIARPASSAQASTASGLHRSAAQTKAAPAAI